MKDWAPVIGELIKIHLQIWQLDTKGIWKRELPRVAADLKQVSGAEAAVGPLDPSFREFLFFADGWPCFYQWVDLFGTPELLGNDFQRALDRLHEVEEVVRSEGVQLTDALPIAMSRREVDNDELDLFVVVRPNAVGAGRVLWITSELIDTFRNFEEFFASMTGYCRAEVEELSSDLTQS